MRFELKRLAVWPFIKVSFFLNLIIGFIIGLLYAMFFGLIVSIMSSFPGMPQQELDVQNLPIGVMMVILPIAFSLMGAFFNTILGTIAILIYNAVARMAGGLELELAEVPAEWPHAAPIHQLAQPAYAPPPPAAAVQPAPPPPPPPAPPAPPASDRSMPPGSKYE